MLTLVPHGLFVIVAALLALLAVASGLPTFTL